MNNQKSPLQTATAIAVVAIGVAYFWNNYGPVYGDYTLKKGEYACATEKEVVTLRGARIMGIFATARALTKMDCIQGPRPAEVKRLARGGQLIHKISIGGRTWYADHDAITRMN